MEDANKKAYKDWWNDIILKYGDILKDHEENIQGHFVRQRIVKYNDTLYVHTMIDGKVVLCEQIKEEKQ